MFLQKPCVTLYVHTVHSPQFLNASDESRYSVRSPVLSPLKCKADICKQHCRNPFLLLLTYVQNLLTCRSLPVPCGSIEIRVLMKRLHARHFNLYSRFVLKHGKHRLLNSSFRTFLPYFPGYLEEPCYPKLSPSVSCPQDICDCGINNVYILCQFSVYISVCVPDSDIHLFLHF